MNDFGTKFTNILRAKLELHHTMETLYGDEYREWDAEGVQEEYIEQFVDNAIELLKEKVIEE